MPRKARKGERLCRCGAYRFPHRQFGGRCRLLTYVQEVYDPGSSDCRGCMNFVEEEGDYGPEYVCQVCSGTEQPYHCPLLRDYVTYEGIVLYGKARRLKEAAERKRR